jgi:phosphoglycerate dehydrogenase-like enzyme
MTEKTRILVLTAPEEDDLPGLEPLTGRCEIHYARDQAALEQYLPETDVLVVTDFRTQMLERAWPAENPIRWVHATSAGVDKLMFPALVAGEIQVTNARGVFDRGIAEYVLGAVLLFAKDTLGNLRFQKEHRWVHRETELIRGKRALIVGAGSIGAEVAGALKAMGMTVHGTARSERDHPPFDHVYANDQLPELLPEADFVVVTAPLTPATEGLFDRKMFQRMKPEARFINVGRGPIVKTDDLLTTLQAGEIAGAALDVLEEEPLPEDHPLWDLPNVMLSAHMAGDFIGWRRALGEQFVANFDRWERDEALTNLVDKGRGFVPAGR